MTDPNRPSLTDTLAAREIVKTMLPSSFAGHIDEGRLDGFGLFERAMAQLIRERAGEEVADG